jgi:hypothetical protein
VWPAIHRDDLLKMFVEFSLRLFGPGSDRQGKSLLISRAFDRRLSGIDQVNRLP